MDSARSQRPAHVINDLPIVIYQPIGTVLFCDHVMELLGLGSLHACLNTGASISRFRNFKYQDCTNRASGVGLCPSSPGSHPQGASLDLFRREDLAALVLKLGPLPFPDYARVRQYLRATCSGCGRITDTGSSCSSRPVGRKARAIPEVVGVKVSVQVVAGRRRCIE